MKTPFTITREHQDGSLSVIRSYKKTQALRLAAEYAARRNIFGQGLYEVVTVTDTKTGAVLTRLECWAGV